MWTGEVGFLLSSGIRPTSNMGMFQIPLKWRRGSISTHFLISPFPPNFHAVIKKKPAMSTTSLGLIYLEEMEAEATATRKCLERVPERLFSWKPHEKSMSLDYLSLLVAEIPKWIAHIVEKGDLDLATFEHYKPATTADLVAHFDDNMAAAKRALKGVTSEELDTSFNLKSNGAIVLTSSKKEIVGSSINHMVHHRGQLTVYLRLNDIPVPSIYGPSADDRGF